VELSANVSLPAFDPLTGIYSASSGRIGICIAPPRLSNLAGSFMAAADCVKRVAKQLLSWSLEEA
jgi:hypothetical protein